MAGEADKTPLILALDGVSRAFDDGRIVGLQDVTLDLAPGELVAVCGHSGSGKSTLLNMMSGLDRPTAGRIAVGGEQNPSPARWAQLRASRIGIVFQDFNLIPTLTASENVQLPMFGQVAMAAARREAALARLAEAGVDYCADRRPPKLSGGERRRVSLARGLANQPELLLADEPTSNLDSHAGAAVMKLLIELHARRAMTLVIVTHDAEVIEACERRIRLLDGRIVEDERRRGAAA